MGTNYYLREESCKCCGHPKKDLHIGKSSAGWCFSLHSIPEENLTSFSAWQERFSRGDIFDEYGTAITIAEMVDMITNRSWGNGESHWDAWAKDLNTGSFGYPSEAEFHRKNYSQMGPNGLLRHSIGAGCIAHGEGTWDMIAGDFS